MDSLSSLVGWAAPILPPEIEEGIQLFESMDEPEQAEHRDIANWTVHKAKAAYARRMTDVTAFRFDADPKVIKALLYSQWPIKSVAASKTYRIMRIKIQENQEQHEDDSLSCAII